MAEKMSTKKKKYNLDRMYCENVNACIDKILENVKLEEERPYNVGAVVQLMQSRKGERLNIFLKQVLGVNRDVLTHAWTSVMNRAIQLDRQNDRVLVPSQLESVRAIGDAND